MAASTGSLASTPVPCCVPKNSGSVCPPSACCCGCCWAWAAAAGAVVSTAASIPPHCPRGSCTDASSQVPRSVT
eukprot:15468695-Alexandrium_andersonii.AAC.1